MKIKFLGTGAADWDITKACADKNFRRFSSAVIDDCLLIDPGPCVFEFSETFGYSLDSIKYIINTHRHADHYNADTAAKLTYLGAEFYDLKANEIKNIGNYIIYAYEANHSTCNDAVHFIISAKDPESKADKSIFYGLDGAWLLYNEIAAIKNFKPDVIVLDATIGDIEGDYRIFEHNNLNMIREMKKTLSPYASRFVISHMARTLHESHDELERKMSVDGIITAYDGMELSF